MKGFNLTNSRFIALNDAKITKREASISNTELAQPLANERRKVNHLQVELSDVVQENTNLKRRLESVSSELTTQKEEHEKVCRKLKKYPNSERDEMFY